MARWVFEAGLKFNPIKCKLLKFVKSNSIATDYKVEQETIALPVHDELESPKAIKS